ncbi:hypothetical protein P170DRAFT_123530 [Aspergillus steynii IBT 23096]|uniref:Uncharacterized protein n=1 Tax=Aspergillus steynii IBT 23096 TaxID=1392250 RepID=A0A2I2GJR0_9EURO|nr:uncharacterized protein P170DRAFT_123530 [Aspergillus steynii IBT 23096]PLB53115.1 hypothetical protein P170DRAFT_123530 [Aspergillus steynii IBT 23096]
MRKTRNSPGDFLCPELFFGTESRISNGSDGRLIAERSLSEGGPTGRKAAVGRASYAARLVVSSFFSRSAGWRTDPEELIQRTNQENRQETRTTRTEKRLRWQIPADLGPSELGFSSYLLLAAESACLRSFIFSDLRTRSYIICLISFDFSENPAFLAACLFGTLRDVSTRLSSK